MKKLLITTLITGALAVSVFAQGTVSFQAGGTTLVQYSTDGTTKTPVPAGSTATVPGQGTLHIAVAYAANGTASPFTASTPSSLSGAWAQSSTTPLSQIGPFPGYTASYTFTLDTIAGPSPAQVMVLAWTGTATTWNDAFNSGTAWLGWSGSTLSGGALAWSNVTGDPVGHPTPTLPQALTTGAAGYNGIVLSAPVVIPEPSSFALAGLGIAALLAFRRRN